MSQTIVIGTQMGGGDPKAGIGEPLSLDERFSSLIRIAEYSGLSESIPTVLILKQPDEHQDSVIASPFDIKKLFRLCCILSMRQLKK